MIYTHWIVQQWLLSHWKGWVPRSCSVHRARHLSDHQSGTSGFLESSWSSAQIGGLKYIGSDGTKGSQQQRQQYIICTLHQGMKTVRWKLHSLPSNCFISGSHQEGLLKLILLNVFITCNIITSLGLCQKNHSWKVHYTV